MAMKAPDPQRSALPSVMSNTSALTSTVAFDPMSMLPGWAQDVSSQERMGCAYREFRSRVSFHPQVDVETSLCAAHMVSTIQSASVFDGLQVNDLFFVRCSILAPARSLQSPARNDGHCRTCNPPR